MADLDIDIIVNRRQLNALDREVRRNIERASVNTVIRVADKVEETTLIRKYTQTSQPAKPLGSTYVRKFVLRAGSVKRLVSTRLPSVEAKWTSQAKYSSYVIGFSSQQSQIHRGRWPSLELVLNNVNHVTKPIFEEEWRRVV